MWAIDPKLLVFSPIGDNNLIPSSRRETFDGTEMSFFKRGVLKHGCGSTSNHQELDRRLESLVPFTRLLFTHV